MDMGRASAKALFAYAARAFETGIGDAFQRRRPRSSDSTMLSLTRASDRLPGVFQRRIRTVYLVGFHLAKTMQAQPGSESHAAQANGKYVIKSG
jgi:hypothetical protein